MMHPVKAISAPLPDVARATTHVVEVTSVDLESEPGSGSQHCFLPAVTFRRGHDLSGSPFLLFKVGDTAYLLRDLL